MRNRPALQGGLNFRTQQSYNQPARFDCRTTHAHIQPRREMKPRLVNMFTIAKELVVNQPKSFTLVECDRTAMSDSIAIVFRNYFVKVFTRLPFKHTRPGFVADHKRRVKIDRVLLATIDLHR